MFGKGVYFSDMFEKSHSYCDYYEFEDEDEMSRKKKHFYMLACEVALGKMFIPGADGKDEFDYDLGFLKKGYNSTKAKSVRGPDPNQTFVMNNGLSIPLGKIIQYERKHDKRSNPYMCHSPEYIVYDTTQIRIRYMIQFEENFE